MGDYEFKINEAMLDEAANKRRMKEALEKSLREENIKVQKKKGKFEVKLTAIILSGLLTVGLVKGINSIKVKTIEVEESAIEEVTEDDNIFNTINMYFSRNDKDSKLNMNNLAKEIGSLVIKPDDSDKFGTDKVSIISQCTHRTSDNKGFYYDIDQMAKETFELDDRDLIEYTISAVLNTMKNDGTINNVVQAGRTNADAYLKACEAEAKRKGIDIVLAGNTEDYIYIKNCKTIDEVIAQEDEKAEFIYEIVIQAQKEIGEGVKKNA